MRIHIWIRTEMVDDLAYFLSDNFNWDREMKIDVWYSNPVEAMGIRDSNAFVQVSVTPDQFKKLEDL